MWTKDDSEAAMNWQTALAFAQAKNTEVYFGHNDWRLPNAKELQSIVDYTSSPGSTNSAAIDPKFRGPENDPKSGTYQGDYLGVDSLGHAVYGHGPQGDILRVNNYVRLVRDASTSAVLEKR